MTTNIIVCACAFVSFIYGCVKFFHPRKALFAKMVTLAAGSVGVGRLYLIVRLLIGGDILSRFQLGELGLIGSFFFFFSANYGLMDSLADDGSKKNRKYRLLALIAPVAAAVIFATMILAGDVSRQIKIQSAVMTILIMGTTYYCLKHFLFPDVDYGVINCLKSYNLLVLLFSFMCLVEKIAIGRQNGVLLLITDVLIGIVILLMTPAMARGIKKWTT